MELLLLRHGTAEEAGPNTGFRDEPRELTDDGRRRMREAAAGMSALGLTPEVVLTSPLARCLQTAEIVCDALGGEPIPDDRLRPGMSLDDLSEAVGEIEQAAQVMVCGHEPSMSLVTADLIGGGDVEFKKGGLAVLALVSVRHNGATLLGLYPPRALRRLGR